MTSKEALEIIQDNLTPRILGILMVEFNIVEKDLERLAVLEHYQASAIALTKENMTLYQQNEKLKKAIVIIIEKDVNIQVLLNSFMFELGLEFYNKHDFIYEQLTQQEYELLKEVINNE